MLEQKATACGLDNRNVVFIVLGAKQSKQDLVSGEDPIHNVQMVTSYEEWGVQPFQVTQSQRSGLVAQFLLRPYLHKHGIENLVFNMWILGDVIISS